MSLLHLLDIDPVALTGYTREVVTGDPHFLEAILPTKAVGDLDFEMARGSTRRGNVAKFRAFNVPAPIGARRPITKIRGSLPPISKKLGLGEEQLIRLQNVIDTGRGDPRLSQSIYDDAGNLGLQIADRFELARAEALYTGKIVLAEGGIVGVTIDFGRAAGHTVSAGTAWSNHAASTVLANLTTWTATYEATNGRGTRPGAWLTSTTVLGHMLANAEILGNLPNILGINPTIATRANLNAVLDAHGIAPIVIYDDQYEVDGTTTRAIPSDRIVAVPPAGEPLGNTFWTTTAEALALRAAGRVTEQEAPGIVATVTEKDDPVNVWTKCSAIGLPFVANPDLTFAADVL